MPPPQKFHYVRFAEEKKTHGVRSLFVGRAGVYLPPHRLIITFLTVNPWRRDCKCTNNTATTNSETIIVRPDFRTFRTGTLYNALKNIAIPNSKNMQIKRKKYKILRYMCVLRSKIIQFTKNLSSTRHFVPRRKVKIQKHSNIL